MRDSSTSVELRKGERAIWNYSRTPKYYPFEVVKVPDMNEMSSLAVARYNPISKQPTSYRRTLYPA